MNAPSRLHPTDHRSFDPTASSWDIFDARARQDFAAGYPEVPHVLSHALNRHPLLELEALAELAEQLDEQSVEFNRGDLPIGVDGKPGATGLSIGETIRHVAEANSWAVLKNVEQVQPYQSLLLDLLGELRGGIEARTGAMLTPQAYIFISSPNAVTPYHFDPEHNILLQVKGSKVMTQFPAGDPHYAPDEVHESYHAGGPRELAWDDAFMQGAREFALAPGQAVYVPVMAPHFVRNGPESSISLSITWRSEWSYAESDARGLNHLLRQRGFTPAAPGRWPKGNRGKAFAFRALRKLGLTGA
ncbi:cupin-like domain-containing protein [uncultured Erythrobacter sp.]|uniref:cupin-like domain-containing protein n=1 Tax=uncultured Erythrobacter sp. TaxID=263913 RepID=UPI002623457B|nr:cupin-like domain-containing protein [uncultured Erythrobacter sp.]